MSVSDSINTIVIVVGGAATVYYTRQQNQIFREQNRIFAAQAGIKMPEQLLVQKSRFGLYWPTIASRTNVLFSPPLRICHRIQKAYGQPWSNAWAQMG